MEIPPPLECTLLCVIVFRTITGSQCAVRMPPPSESEMLLEITESRMSGLHP